MNLNVKSGRSKTNFPVVEVAEHRQEKGKATSRKEKMDPKLNKSKVPSVLGKRAKK